MAWRYLDRVADNILDERLRSAGAVLIEGPRGCGKTTTGTRQARTVTRVDSHESLTAADIDPRLLLEGAAPVLLDEWQAVPTVWNAVRREVDDRRLPGQFILTGSARPADDPSRHSGAGRFSRVIMRPLSLWESGISSGAVSLAELLHGDQVSTRCGVSFSEYLEAVVRGGWPAVADAPIGIAQSFARDYVDSVAEEEVASLDLAQRDPRRLRAFLEAYAALTAHPVPLSRVIFRTAAPDDAQLSRASGDTYARAVGRLMVTDDVPAWSTHLRSRARLTEYPKRHLADPSLACALLRATPEALRKDLTTLGFLFESMVTRDLRVYASNNDAEVFHYRERGGELAVDLIVEQRGGAWIGVEVKMGIGQVDAAAAALRRLADSRIQRPPAALVVVTATEYGYTRADGVSVVPLAALRP